MAGQGRPPRDEVSQVDVTAFFRSLLAKPSPSPSAASASPPPSSSQAPQAAMDLYLRHHQPVMDEVDDEEEDIIYDAQRVSRWSIRVHDERNNNDDNHIIYENDDHDGLLPVDVLHHIFSFLDNRHAGLLVGPGTVCATWRSVALHYMHTMSRNRPTFRVCLLSDDPRVVRLDTEARVSRALAFAHANGLRLRTLDLSSPMHECEQFKIEIKEEHLKLLPKTLRTLNLRGCDIKSVPSPFWESLATITPSLRTLELTGLNCPIIYPPGPTTLTNLVLESCLFDGHGYPDITKLPHLTSLEVSKNLVIVSYSCLRQCTQLRQLTISNLFTASLADLPSSLEALTIDNLPHDGFPLLAEACPGLRFLCVKSSYGLQLQALPSSLEHLHVDNLNSTSWTGDDLPHLRSMSVGAHLSHYFDVDIPTRRCISSLTSLRCPPMPGLYDQLNETESPTLRAVTLHAVTPLNLDEWIAKHPNITALDMTYQASVGELLALRALIGYEHLRVLDLRNSKISSETLQHLPRALRWLGLGAIEGTEPTSALEHEPTPTAGVSQLKELKGLSELRKLRFSTPIDGRWPEFIVSSCLPSSLRSLSIDFGSVGGAEFQWLTLRRLLPWNVVLKQPAHSYEPHQAFVACARAMRRQSEE